MTEVTNLPEFQHDFVYYTERRSPMFYHEFWQNVRPIFVLKVCVSPQSEFYTDEFAVFIQTSAPQRWTL